MVKETIYAIIPARGGSKRIPRKNIIDLNGLPMIAWTIKAALNSKYISRVFVSTDDPEIAEVSKSHGAEVPVLRTSYYDDNSSISNATIHTLNQLEELGFKTPDITVQLMANCPVRNAIDIDMCLEFYAEGSDNSVISCFKYGWMNPWWAHQVTPEGRPEPLFKEALSSRSQDLPELYCPTGAIWVANTQKLFFENTFYGKDYRFYELDWFRAIDIDDYADLKMAEYLLSH